MAFEERTIKTGADGRTVWEITETTYDVAGHPNKTTRTQELPELRERKNKEDKK